MGADIKKLRNRIKSVNSTLHLTKAMGLVASSKIKRANRSMFSSREYRNSYAETIDVLTQSTECAKSPYMQKRDGGRVCLICIAGDRGLAGGYNANVFKLCKEYENASFIPIGKRACERFSLPILLVENFCYNDAKKISDKICSDFANGEYDKVGIVYTKYISIMSQEAEIKWILPLEKANVSNNTSIIFEPDEITVLNSAIPEYIAATIISLVKESYASEVAARRVAMDSAEKNAQEMIDELGIEYNRARQGAITQEITEIVAGSGL